MMEGSLLFKSLPKSCLIIHAGLWICSIFAPLRHVQGYLWILMLIFSVGPIFFSFYMSLTEWKLSGAGHFIGLNNFRELFVDATIWLELKNSMVYTLFKVPIGVAISLILAYFLNQKVPFKGLFRVIYFLPSITMTVAIGLVWRYLFNSQYGIVNVIL